MDMTEPIIGQVDATSSDVHNEDSEPVVIRFDALSGFPGGSFKPSVQSSFKTIYQSTLENCLTATAIAFANRNYVEVFDEQDLVLKAARMAEMILNLTALRVRHAIMDGDAIPFDAGKFYGVPHVQPSFVSDVDSESPLIVNDVDGVHDEMHNDTLAGII